MKALVLSAGGASGSYHVGVIRHLLSDLKIHYDILCGTSCGGINAAAIGMFKKGQEINASKYLEDIWLNIDNHTIFKRHFPFGILSSLFKPSFYNSSPLHDLINKHIDIDKIRNSGKVITVGATSLTTGKYRVFDQNYHNFAGAVIAGAAYQSVFSPVELDGELYSDGGVYQYTPIKSAIDCGATHLDIIIPSSINQSQLFTKNPNAIQVLQRSWDIVSENLILHDIDKLMTNNVLAATGLSSKKHISYNIIRPQHVIIKDSLNFDPNEIKQTIQMGYEDAKNILNI